MKIVFDFRIFIKQRHGGISRYFYEVARRIAGEPGTEAGVLAPLHVNHYLKGSGLGEGIYLRRLPGALISSAERANELLSLARIRARTPHILHETYYASRGLAGRSTRTATTVYDMIHEKFPALYPGDETPRLKAESVKRADHIFCISRRTQEDLIEILGVEERKTSVLHLGCDFNLRKGEVRAASPFPFPYLLFVGPRGAHKNFRALVAAYAASEPVRNGFKVVCFGSTPFQAEELGLIRSLKLSPEDFLHVRGEDDWLPTYYAHAAAFVYPSLYEGFGFPPLEAMSLGCPTVSARAGSMPEVLGAATEYFDPLRPDHLAAALEKVLFSGEHRAQLRQRGEAQAAAYTWGACAAESLARYRALL